MSAIMPAYNQVDFVGEAIRSAVDQDYANLQVIVSDDGSTDGTVDIILDWARRYPDRVIPIVREGHLGVTDNCNRALDRCRGELRAFHAGDDLWLPGKVSIQVAWFEEDSRRVLCGHDVEVFDSETGQPMFRWSEHQDPPSGDDARLFVRQGNPWHPLGNMARADVIPASGYDGRIPLASDWKFFIDCVARGGAFGHVPGVYARYRSWKGNVSRRREQMWADLFSTLDLVAVEYPWLADACLEYRSSALHAHGVELVSGGSLSEARARFVGSAVLRPWTRRGIAWLAIAALPTPIADRALAIWWRQYGQGK
ncbi:MAG: glycosyltransferase family 2 protein [Gemmatimonadaceae bacterium]